MFVIVAVVVGDMAVVVVVLVVVLDASFHTCESLDTTRNGRH